MTAGIADQQFDRGAGSAGTWFDKHVPGIWFVLLAGPGLGVLIERVLATAIAQSSRTLGGLCSFERMERAVVWGTIRLLGFAALRLIVA